MNKAILSLLVLVGLTACGQFQTVQQSSGPTVTYADPAARAALVANEAYFVGQTATSDALYRISTQVSFDRAAAAATQAAAGATTTREAQNAAATQYAASAGMTQTAGAVDLQNRAIAVTQTALALSVDQVVATQQAALADEARLTSEQKTKEAAQNDLNRQAHFVLGLIVAGIAIVIAGAFGWQVVRLFGVWIAIKARRLLLVEQAGALAQYDPDAGRWELMQGYSGQLPPPTPEPPTPQEDKSRAWFTMRTRDGVLTPEQIDQRIEEKNAQAQRAAWVLAARQYLRLGEIVGFSQRKMQDVGVDRLTWETMNTFLIAQGALVAGRNKTLELVRGESGEVQTANQYMARAFWVNHFDVPNTPPPPIPVLKNENTPTRHTTAHTNTHEHTQTHTPNTPENPAFVVGRDASGRKTLSRWSSVNPPPRTYEQLIEDYPDIEST